MVDFYLHYTEERMSNILLSDAIWMGGVLSSHLSRKAMFAPDGGTCPLGGAALACGFKRGDHKGWKSEEERALTFLRFTFPSMSRKLSDDLFLNGNQGSMC